MVMTGVMRRFSAALAAAAMAVSIVPFADISAYAEYSATHPEGFVYADGSNFMWDGIPYYYGGTNCYYLTYKSKGLLSREEYNLPLTKESYDHLISKADGNIISKKRYFIPIEGTELTIEFDVFEGKFEGLMLAEVEFETVEEAEAFTPPEWFGRDVTFSGEYQNSRLAGLV